MRRYRLRPQILQSLAVGCAAFLLGAGAWFALWPYSQRSMMALGAGVLAALFCGAASWMRSHDDSWEAANLRTEPLLSPARARRNRDTKKAAKSAKRAEKPAKAPKSKKKRGKGASETPHEAGVGYGGTPL